MESKKIEILKAQARDETFKIYTFRKSVSLNHECIEGTLVNMFEYKVVPILKSIFLQRVKEARDKEDSEI
jgi:hypothetical protein